MSGLFYEFDPGGDVVFVLKDVPHSLPHSLGDLAASDLSGRHDSRQPRPPNTPAPGPSIGMVNEVKPRSLHIQASSKHMTLASPQFMRTFQHGFREGTALHSVGHVEIPIYDWKPLPFLLLMAILHGRNRLVPRALSLHRLAEMAVLVDYYECYDAVVILSDLWIEAVGQDRPYLCGEKLMEWLCITWVFQRGIDFSLITGTIQLEIGGVITANNLPVPAAIIGMYYPSMIISAALKRNEK
ncbi:hypothetical protein BDV26DRAFT_276551 [Aspergillus bertholletiae]|uniref:BTB domain-containing protein n=1 Tax=Aspergillus bertholletiae TaxID=1226010 RepID=A0A5N7AMZ7_9EURO|nr:hypothetical protein BDV26DRAFT_276551 [Aspergillus bertholletiae]